MSVDIDFANLRAESGDRREGFEEFSAQLFHRYTVPAGSRYERFRGAGGDGGVEAVWHLPSGNVVGLQSKFFLPLKDAHLKQLEKSLDTALENYPKLERYIVTLPFDPTPTVAARAGKSGQNEKLETWRLSLEARASKPGAKVTVEWWFASELKSRLLGLENSDGRILYWFGASLLSGTKLDTLVSIAETIAGKRYSPELKVDTGAGEVLSAFGLDAAWFSAHQALIANARSIGQSWKSRTPGASVADATLIQAALDDADNRLSFLVERSFDEADRLFLVQACNRALPVIRTLEGELKADFDKTHGAGNDTPRWRQFQASYQISFPAAELDLARDAMKLFQDILNFAEGDAAKAATAKILLMRGAAGIGKTHTTIDAAKMRVASGRGAIVILGQEIAIADDPWRVIASKLGMSLTSTRSELLGVLACYAEETAAPIMLMIDAINETSDRSRWQSWLPALSADIEGRPVRLLVTCRDIYLDEAVGPSLTKIPSFTHDGFLGREYEAAYAFASFYKVGPPAEVVAQPEFANPLFLHLVCRAALSRRWLRIPGGQISLTVLIEAILDGANEEAAKLLDYDPRLENPVKEGALALARAMGKTNVRAFDLAAANAILKTIRPSAAASRSLLRALETADLVSTNSENGFHTLRFAFERLGDLLIAAASIEGDDEARVRQRFGKGDLASLVTSEAAISANAGLLQAFSIILPERFQAELVDMTGSAHISQLTPLALDVLAWRDPTTLVKLDWVFGEGRGEDFILAFAKVLAVAAAPDHPLNIDWVWSQLQRYPLQLRDALWTSTLTRSWYADGAVRQLINIAQKQTLRHLSLESAKLLGRTLAAFTSSADLILRDEATVALANLLDNQPIAGDLVEHFLNDEDDYIRERVLLVVYYTGLRKRDASFWREIVEPVYGAIFVAGGTASEHVAIRDFGRLVVEEADAAGVLPPGVNIAKARPPYTSGWPLNFSYADWEMLLKANPDLPTNLRLGDRHGPDFARYTVKHATDTFDLAAASLDLGRLNRWIVEQVLGLGYGGTNRFALAYDHILIDEIGDGRGAAVGRERISKKYQRIFLARLVGKLHDNVPRQVSHWSPPPNPLGLQGVRFRDLDPSNLDSKAEAELSGERSTELLQVAPFDPSKTDRQWIEGIKRSAMSFIDGPNLMLSGILKRDEKVGGRLERRQERSFRSYIVSKTMMTKIRKIDESGLPYGDIPEINQLFSAEYPRSFAYRTDAESWHLEAHPWGRQTTIILKGNEDGYVATRDIWVPDPELILFANAEQNEPGIWKNASQQSEKCDRYRPSLL
ncbi:hypothetical protein B5K11_32135 [Rhizobium leguminosarum bv. trifolii]|uniref:hypothetical protein n=1 Tax=Rhizobium leguminosarum TaxID=384 RepID=UPI000E2E5E5A|nr:hypothetical protein [Rhizobium leguminosarum]RFB84791.1 hypothetical protein B5K11_32135 [Rhizobium leguminosarum bv. trifolii]